jgi:hypothetical protein
MSRFLLISLLAGPTLMVVHAQTQTRRAASPPGASVTQVGGVNDPRTGFVNGSWIEIRHGRPLKRGRNLFGASDFVDFLNDGAPVWRAGANQSTQLLTEAPLTIGGRTLPTGEYTLFIDLAPNDRWTLIVSSWAAQTTYNADNRAALWGAYEYTPDRDLVRTPMQVERLAHSFEQLSWQFLDMTEKGGKLALMWDRKLASVSFTVTE